MTDGVRQNAARRYPAGPQTGSCQRISSDQFEGWILGAPHRLVNLLYRVGERLVCQALLSAARATAMATAAETIRRSVTGR